MLSGIVALCCHASVRGKEGTRPYNYHYHASNVCEHFARDKTVSLTIPLTHHCPKLYETSLFPEALEVYLTHLNMSNSVCGPSWIMDFCFQLR